MTIFTQQCFISQEFLPNKTTENTCSLVPHCKSPIRISGVFVFLNPCMHEQNEDCQKASYIHACCGDTTECSVFFLKNIFEYQPSMPLSSSIADYLLNTLTIVGASNTLSSVTSMHTNLFSSLILALLIDKVQFSERLNRSLYSGTSS